ncbi:MAG: tetratricopeptide repeat protein [Chitinophagaceae bacterium]|nr:tetratricopeptide repeat protein [Chitinophagaceae bacterium]
MNKERIELLKKFREEDVNDPFPIYGLAMEYLHELPDQASALFDLLLSEHADYLPVYYTAAHFLLEQGNEKRAKLILKKGIELSIQQQNDKATRELKAALEQLEFE